MSVHHRNRGRNYEQQQQQQPSLTLVPSPFQHQVQVQVDDIVVNQPQLLYTITVDNVDAGGQPAVKEEVVEKYHCGISSWNPPPIISIAAGAADPTNNQDGYKVIFL
jgi:hypothetical protein